MEISTLNVDFNSVNMSSWITGDTLPTSMGIVQLSGMPCLLPMPSKTTHSVLPRFKRLWLVLSPSPDNLSPFRGFFRTPVAWGLTSSYYLILVLTPQDSKSVRASVSTTATKSCFTLSHKWNLVPSPNQLPSAWDIHAYTSFCWTLSVWRRCPSLDFYIPT